VIDRDRLEQRAMPSNLIEDLRNALAAERKTGLY
jgi:hypothetical protein